MFSTRHITLVGAAALAALSWAHSAAAADEVPASSSGLSVFAAPEAPTAPSAESPSSVGPRPVPAAADPSRNPFGSKPLAAGELAAKRGGDRISNDIELNGVVKDNYAKNLTTGSNQISAGAFAGSSGFSTTIQNSGNNVLIQNATILNIQLK